MPSIRLQQQRMKRHLQGQVPMLLIYLLQILFPLPGNLGIPLPVTFAEHLLHSFPPKLEPGTELLSSRRTSSGTWTLTPGAPWPWFPAAPHHSSHSIVNTYLIWMPEPTFRHQRMEVRTRNLIPRTKLITPGLLHQLDPVQCNPFVSRGPSPQSRSQCEHSGVPTQDPVLLTLPRHRDKQPGSLESTAWGWG